MIKLSLFLTSFLFAASVAAQTYIQGPALIQTPTTTATAAGTTTLTNASQTNQQFTGSTTQIVVLPNATTLPKGRSFYISNRSSGTVTVNYNGGSLAKSMPGGSETLFIVENNSTAAGTWDVSGGTVVLGVGTFDSQTPSANGAVASSNFLYLQSASATVPGLVNNTTQSMSGNKTFTGTISASNLSGTNTGDITIGAFGSSPNANGLSLSGQAINLQPADATRSGGLSSTDWNTFNGKQPAGSYLTAVSISSANGFAGSSGGGTTPALTISTTVTGILQGNGTAISAATTGNLTDTGTDGITITSGTGAVLGSGTSLSQHVADSTHNGYLSSGDWSTFNGKQASGNYITALTGDGSASGPGSVALTLATVNSNVGSFGSATQVGTFTVNAKGLVTAASNTSIAIPFSQISGTITSSQITTSTFTAPTVQRFTSSSGTYTTPTSPRVPLYIKIKLIGGGGGGGGGGDNDGGNGGAGTDSTWSVHSGAVILTASGGAAGQKSGNSAAGGSATNAGGATTVDVVAGGAGSPETVVGTISLASNGGMGGVSYRSGNGVGGNASSGTAAATNSGSGGGGGASGLTATSRAGGGGGAGGYIEASIANPAASYDYAVGAGGGFGAAGTSGQVGGNGAAGVIVIEEYYQ